jgi:hypothetical protein
MPSTEEKLHGTDELEETRSYSHRYSYTSFPEITTESASYEPNTKLSDNPLNGPAF